MPTMAASMRAIQSSRSVRPRAMRIRAVPMISRPASCAPSAPLGWGTRARSSPYITATVASPPPHSSIPKPRNRHSGAAAPPRGPPTRSTNAANSAEPARVHAAARSDVTAPAVMPAGIDRDDQGRREPLAPHPPRSSILCAAPTPAPKASAPSTSSSRPFAMCRGSSGDTPRIGTSGEDCRADRPADGGVGRGHGPTRGADGGGRPCGWTAVACPRGGAARSPAWAWSPGGGSARGGRRPADRRAGRRARSRLRACDRSSEATTRTSSPSRSSRRARWRGPSDGDPATSKRTSARVSAVLACWPPGPPDRLNRHDSSASGIDEAGRHAQPTRFLRHGPSVSWRACLTMPAPPPTWIAAFAARLGVDPPSDEQVDAPPRPGRRRRPRVRAHGGADRVLAGRPGGPRPRRRARGSRGRSSRTSAAPR